MLFNLAHALICFLADLFLVRMHADAQLRAEVLALRHQLRVLERKLGKPRWQPGDRIVLAALSRFLPRSAWSALLPSPETLLRWHWELGRRKWAAFSRHPPRPAPRATRTSKLWSYAWPRRIHAGATVGSRARS
jgi:putative transposase